MQMDFHFYSLYTLCRGAGLKPDVSRRIAYASQYTDDAKYPHALTFRDDQRFKQEMTSHEYLSWRIFTRDVQFQIYSAFHFLPGDMDGHAALKDTPRFRERMICAQDSAVSRELLAQVEKIPDSPYSRQALGIALHAYADTFAHRNFSALCRGFADCGKINDAEALEVMDPSTGEFAEYKPEKGWMQILLPVSAAASFACSFIAFLFIYPFNLLKKLFKGYAKKIEFRKYEIAKLGHAQVGELPDEPFREWRYRHVFYDEIVSAKNWEIYLATSERIYQILRDLIGKKFFRDEELSEDTVEWSILKPRMEELFKTPGSLGLRCDNWLWKIRGGFFGFAFPGDALLKEYDDKEWFNECIECRGRLWGTGEVLYRALKKIMPVKSLIAAWLLFNYRIRNVQCFKDSDWKKFHDAASWQRDKVLREIMSDRCMICG